uniref:Uncharacterized protein n=1 Tax=viral metagenome TaxID=1070528 RepID=A0A6H1ZNZ0_9ZZZZ
MNANLTKLFRVLPRWKHSKSGWKRVDSFYIFKSHKINSKEFQTKIVSFLKKIFPNKKWSSCIDDFSTEPVTFSLCELNEFYDSIGMQGNNVCDSIKELIK